MDQTKTKHRNKKALGPYTAERARENEWLLRLQANPWPRGPERGYICFLGLGEERELAG